MITDAGVGSVVLSGRSISCTGQRTVPQPTTITTSHKTVEASEVNQLLSVTSSERQ